MFKSLDGIVTPGMVYRSFGPIYVVLRTVDQSILADDRRFKGVPAVLHDNIISLNPQAP